MKRRLVSYIEGGKFERQVERSAKELDKACRWIIVGAVSYFVFIYFFRG
jgi:hypothetical protein